MTDAKRKETNNHDEEMSNAMRAFSGEDPDTIPTERGGVLGIATMATCFVLTEMTRPARVFCGLTTKSPDVRKILLHEI